MRTGGLGYLLRLLADRQFLLQEAPLRVCDGRPLFVEVTGIGGLRSADGLSLDYLYRRLRGFDGDPDGGENKLFALLQRGSWLPSIVARRSGEGEEAERGRYSAKAFLPVVLLL